MPINHIVIDLDASVIFDFHSLTLADGRSGLAYFQELAEALAPKGMAVTLDISDLTLQEISRNPNLALPEDGILVGKTAQELGARYGSAIDALLSLECHEHPMLTQYYKHDDVQLIPNHYGGYQADTAIIHHSLLTEERANTMRIVMTRDAPLLHTLVHAAKGPFALDREVSGIDGHFRKLYRRGDHIDAKRETNRLFANYAQQLMRENDLASLPNLFACNTGTLLRGMEVLRDRGASFSDLQNQHGSTYPFTKRNAKAFMRDHDIRKKEAALAGDDSVIHTPEDLQLTSEARDHMNMLWSTLLGYQHTRSIIFDR